MALDRNNSEIQIPGSGWNSKEAKPSRILVTGHKGMIGQNLWKIIRADGNLIGRGMDLPDYDITSVDAAMYCVTGQEHVIHLAAEAEIKDAIIDPYGCYRVNVTGTMNILRASREHRVERVVFASSGMAQGSESPYGASKASGEAYMKAFHNTYGLSTVILRLENVYGKYSMHKNSAITNFITAAIFGDPLVITGDGMTLCDFVFADDVSNAILLATEVSDSKVAGKTIRIGTGVSTTINELVDIIQDAHGSELNIRREDGKVNRIMQNSTDTWPAEDVLGFKSTVSLEDGIKKTYDWLKMEIERIEKFHKV